MEKESGPEDFNCSEDKRDDISSENREKQDRAPAQVRWVVSDI